MVEQQPFKLLVLGSSPRRLTKKEIVSELGAALAASPLRRQRCKGKIQIRREPPIH